MFCTLQQNPFNKITLVNDTKVFDGYCLEIIWLLSEIFNFTYTLEEAYDFGAEINGSWSGMVGRTIRKVRYLTLQSAQNNI